jgi:hypothetical protein
MASTYLSRTFSGTYNSGTISMWLKRSNIGSQYIFYNESSTDSNDYGLIQFDSSDRIEFMTVTNGAHTQKLITNRVFRDTNAWYHFVFATDTDNATADNRFRIYVNGVEETSFATRANGSQGDTNYLFQTSASSKHRFFASSGGSANLDGLAAHIHVVPNSQLASTVFGETDSTSGIWKPKTNPSVTYTAQGAFLKFANSASLGLDSSGNTNNFTVSGTGTQTQDTPSNNFAVMNPLDNYYNSSTFNNGNTTVVTSSSGYSGVIGGMGAASGKWYFEFKPVSKTGDSDEYTVGITGAPVTAVNQPHYRLATGYMYLGVNGQSYNNDTGTAYGNTFTAGDIIGVAMDLDNNKLYFSKNGTWQNSGDPTSGATGTGAISITAPGSTPIGFYLPCCAFVSNTYSATMSFNFGNGYFGTTAVSSSNSDGDGLGLFEYSVPTGYYALCTKNIKNYG